VGGTGRSKSTLEDLSCGNGLGLSPVRLQLQLVCVPRGVEWLCMKKKFGLSTEVWV
jgi:hypothetical protein